LVNYKDTTTYSVNGQRQTVTLYYAVTTGTQTRPRATPQKTSRVLIRTKTLQATWWWWRRWWSRWW